MLTEYELYRRQVDNISDRLKIELLKTWNGYDYYDNEYIKNNFNLHHLDPKYPTIDHKASVKYGYLNHIDEEIIADISNLCITKRRINSSKRAKNEEYFNKQIK